jgi:hypothetical protein
MSLFDIPRIWLNPAIFDRSEIMHPHVLNYLQALLTEFFPLGKVSELALIGSNVTHQYDEDSDLDISLVATKGETSDQWHSIFKEWNQQNHYLPGTEHVITYYFHEYMPTRSDSWKNSMGAYDLLRNQWIKRPRDYKDIGDPEALYANEKAYVKLMMNMVNGEVHAIKVALAQGDRDKAYYSLQTLQQFMKKIDTDRKTSYQYGGGSPSSSENNLIYKLVTEGEYGDLLKDLIGE